MILDIEIPNEPFGSMVKDGSVGEKIQQILGDIQPEAAYFSEHDGQRGALIVVDVPDASAVPRLAEPFFLTFDASVSFRICMTADDLGAAGLDEIGQKYG